jgi:hypothetical protein
VIALQSPPAQVADCREWAGTSTNRQTPLHSATTTALQGLAGRLGALTGRPPRARAPTAAGGLLVLRGSFWTALPLPCSISGEFGLQ